MHPLISDIAQRVITLNKSDQRRYLLRLLRGVQKKTSSRILDFGCGTGLFAPVIKAAGHHYVGYDIDWGAVDYARRMYRYGNFIHNRSELNRRGPFDVVLANCCFHHIDNNTLSKELSFIDKVLAQEGTFIMIDILKVENDLSFSHRVFMELERGQFVRTEIGYLEIISKFFKVVETDIHRSYVFSLKWCFNKLYNDVLVLVCKTK